MLCISLALVFLPIFSLASRHTTQRPCIETWSWVMSTVNHINYQWIHIQLFPYFRYSLQFQPALANQTKVIAQEAKWVFPDTISRFAPGPHLDSIQIRSEIHTTIKWIKWDTENPLLQLLIKIYITSIIIQMLDANKSMKISLHPYKIVHSPRLWSIQ